MKCPRCGHKYSGSKVEIAGTESGCLLVRCYCHECDTWAELLITQAMFNTEYLDNRGQLYEGAEVDIFKTPIDEKDVGV